jgi:hypothetical protein
MKTTTGLMLIAAGFAMGADSADWAEVRGLHTGDRVGVIRADHRRIEGSFEGADAGMILIRDGQQVMIAKDDVVRVYKPARVDRLKRVLIGAGVGAVAAAIVDQTYGERLRNEGTNYFRGWEAAGAYSVGVGVGAATGALSGGGDKTVYRRSDPVKK